ncbi:MAG: hypothetical protein ACYSW6_10115 [Planctomycetota bacterium]|jgi:hypothetical protein
MMDLRERLTGENIIEPLLFEDGEIDIFIRDKSCGFCAGHLFKKFAPDRKYTAHCPEHGVMYEHTHISKHKAERVEQDTRVGGIELREPKKKRTEQEILSDLGFGGKSND